MNVTGNANDSGTNGEHAGRYTVGVALAIESGRAVLVDASDGHPVAIGVSPYNHEA